MSKIKQEGTVKIEQYQGFYVGFDHDTKEFYYNPNGRRMSFRTLAGLKDHIGSKKIGGKKHKSGSYRSKSYSDGVFDSGHACWRDYYEACIK